MIQGLPQFTTSQGNTIYMALDIYIYIYMLYTYITHKVKSLNSDDHIYIYIYHSLMLPDECGHLLTIRNKPVAIKR